MEGLLEPPLLVNKIGSFSDIVDDSPASVVDKDMASVAPDIGSIRLLILNGLPLLSKAGVGTKGVVLLLRAAPPLATALWVLLWLLARGRDALRRPLPLRGSCASRSPCWESVGLRITGGWGFMLQVVRT